MAAERSGSERLTTPRAYQHYVQPNSVQLLSRIPLILPHERVFPIQIGSELFKLSGASLSSDGADSLIAMSFFTSSHLMSPPSQPSPRAG